jgi:hypothetical protein
VKRIKLDYDEIGSCGREVMEVWDLLTSKESRVSTQCDSKMLLQAIRQGEACDLPSTDNYYTDEQVQDGVNFVCGLFPFLTCFIFSFHSYLFSQSQSSIPSHSIGDITLSMQHLNLLVLTHYQRPLGLKHLILQCVIIKFVFNRFCKLLN